MQLIIAKFQISIYWKQTENCDYQVDRIKSTATKYKIKLLILMWWYKIDLASKSVPISENQ